MIPALKDLPMLISNPLARRGAYDAALQAWQDVLAGKELQG